MIEKLNEILCTMPNLLLEVDLTTVYTLQNSELFWEEDGEEYGEYCRSRQSWFDNWILEVDTSQGFYVSKVIPKKNLKIED